MKTPLATLALLVALASTAHAADWTGAWVVGSTPLRTRVLQGAPKGFSLAVDLEGEPFLLEGAATGDSLVLEGTGRPRTVGIAGALQGEKTEAKPRRGRLVAALANEVVHARFSVEDRLVFEETWSRGRIEILALETPSGAKVGGALDLKVEKGMHVRFRSTAPAVALRAHLECVPGSSFTSFYGIASIGTFSLGTVEPGEHVFRWDGRDGTVARRLLLEGTYRIVIDEDRPEERSRGSAEAPPEVAKDAAGLDDAPTTTVKLAKRPDLAAPASNETGRKRLGDERTFSVAPPRYVGLASIWKNGEYQLGVNGREWNPPERFATASTFLNALGPGWKVVTRTVREPEDLAPMREAACLHVTTHGSPGKLWFFDERGKDLAPDDPRRKFSADWWQISGVDDVHFALVAACWSAYPGTTGTSIAKRLVSEGCDVAVGTATATLIAETERWTDIAFALIRQGSPIEKASRDAARASFRAQFDVRDLSEVELDRAILVSPVYGDEARAIAQVLVVERDPRVPADESAWPPRYGRYSR